MAERRALEKAAKDDTSAYDRSFHLLNQFNQIKSIAGNQSFIHNNDQILCTEIVADVIDEMRRERKIKMAIREANHVKEYVMINI